MAQQHKAMIARAKMSEEENMSEIQSLAQRVRDLNQSVDWWNTAIIWSLVFVALAAVAVVLTTRMSVTQAKKLSDAQNELIDAKDRDAAKDIAEAKAAAAEANKRTAEIEKENLKLQQQIANRRITKEQHNVMVEFLSKKHGQVVIQTMSDSESGLFASDVLKTFTDAGWSIGGTFFPLGEIWTGLIIYDSADPDAAVIAQAFELAGIPFVVAKEKKDKATIMVGGKPPIF